MDLDLIKKVIYNGANETDLATDHAYNDNKLFANQFIRDGVAGNWFDLTTGQKITDPNNPFGNCWEIVVNGKDLSEVFPDQETALLGLVSYLKTGRTETAYYMAKLLKD